MLRPNDNRAVQFKYIPWLRPCEKIWSAFCTSESYTNQPALRYKKQTVKFSKEQNCKSPVENFQMVSTFRPNCLVVSTDLSQEAVFIHLYKVQNKTEI